MPEAEWQALGPHAPDPDTGRRARSIETHPQFQLKLLLDRMGINRGEVETWREGGGHDAGAIRGRAVANALAPADFTGKRSEEHTSELQSLMRISYAVFCLKKTNTQTQ